MKEFVHIAAGNEASAGSWCYTVIKEEIIRIQGRDLLCVVGDAVVGSACVGTAAVRVIVIPGFIIESKAGDDILRSTISIVDPVIDDEGRRIVSETLMAAHPSYQLVFL